VFRRIIAVSTIITLTSVYVNVHCLADLDQ